MIPEATMLVLSGLAAWTNPIKQGDVAEPGLCTATPVAVSGEKSYEGGAGLQDTSAPAKLYRYVDSSPDHWLRVGFANDQSFDMDGNYTQGTRIDYFERLSRVGGWGVSLSQNIYTPEVHTNGAVPRQHPYAGLLSLGVAWGASDPDMGYVAEFQIGTTGKPSLAREAQNGVHKMLGMETWDGWGEQVPAEVTFQLTVAPAFNLPFMAANLGNGWQTDGLFYTRAEMGTVRLAGGAGIGFRIGKNLPSSMQILGSPAGTFGFGPIEKPGYKIDEISYFLVFNVYGEYVGRDITIDGGVFHHFDRTCSRRPWQVEGSIGIGVSYQNIDYFAGARLHSRAYGTQDKNGGMGVFSIGWKW